MNESPRILETASSINELSRQRAVNPLDPAVARRWCAAALGQGQAQQVPAYAAQLYSQEKDPLRKAEWARLGAMAAFRLLHLEQALAAYTVSTGHLCELAESGRAPAPLPCSDAPNAFASGEAEALLWATGAALARAGFAAFPYSGTLLGLVREGSLLPFDKDIDLAIWSEDFGRCGAWLEQQGWRPLRDLPPYANFRAFLHPQSKLTLDLIGLKRYPHEKTMQGGFELAGYPEQYQSLRTFPLVELVQRATPAGEVWFVKESDPLLTALYGDWRTPNPAWDGMVSCGGLSEPTLLTRCYASDRLLERWFLGRLDRAWAYAHQILLKDPSDFSALRVRQSLGRLLALSNPGALNWPPKLTPGVPR